jgi:hypothetical protein
VAQAVEEGLRGAEQLGAVAEFLEGVGDEAGDRRLVLDDVDEFGFAGLGGMRSLAQAASGRKAASSLSREKGLASRGRSWSAQLVLGFGEAAHQHHRQIGPEAPHEAGQGPAVHGAGHHHVGDDQGDGRDVLDHVGGLGAVLGLDHRAAQLGELHAHHAAHVGVVLGQQHQLAGQVGGGHVPRRQGFGCSASSMRGSSRATVVPRAWRLRMRTPPPDCLVKPYTIDMPRPLPMPNCLVVKKGSKTRARVLPSMPMPLSVTAICT